MGKKGRDRSQRRRGFDDGEYSASPSYDNRSRQPFRSAPREVPPSGPSANAIVKWFNAEKGFGFVELTDGSGDVFLHAAVLEGAGQSTVEPGTKLSVQVAVGQKGRQVTSVLAVDASAAAAPRTHMRPPAKTVSGRERPDPATATNI